MTATVTIENGAIHIRFVHPPDSAVRAGITQRSANRNAPGILPAAACL